MSRPLWTVLAAIALFAGGVTTLLVSAGADGAKTPARPITWLAAGDSYSSGEGLPHSTGGCAQAPGDSSRAWAQVAASTVQDTGSIKLASPLTFRACTGALSSQFFAAQGNNAAEWSPADGKYDLVTFTFGGDDVDFPNIIKQCIGLPVFSHYVQPDPGHMCPADATLRQRVKDNVQNVYPDFLRKVAKNAVNANGNVVVLGYPELVEDPQFWGVLAKYTHLCSGITDADARELRGLAGDLNATIGNAVNQANSEHPNGVHFTFLDINSGGSNGIGRADPRLFEPSQGTRHNLCAGDPWMNGLSTIDYLQGSFHPKQAGLDAEGSMLAQVLTTSLDWSGTSAPTSTPTTATSTTTSADAGSHPGSSAANPQLNINGHCTVAGGTLVGTSSGFTPGGRYTVTAQRPSGQDYPLGSGSQGTVRSDGTIKWAWPCRGDAAGTYHTTVTDSFSGKSTPSVAFDIEPAPQSSPPTLAAPTSHQPPASRAPAPTKSRPPRTTSPPALHAVTVFDNYADATGQHYVCRGNPDRRESMPGGVVAQSFTVGAGVAQVDSATVQIDGDPRITVHAQLLVGDTPKANADVAAANDTHIDFGQVAVRPGDTVTLKLTLSATFGKLVYMYSAGPPANATHFSIANSCSDGAEPVDTTSTALRAQVFGVGT